jgi:hypothetical protein
MKTIKYLLILTILILNGNVFSQQANEFKFYYGTSNAELKQKEVCPGRAGYKIQSFNEFGFRYSREVYKNLSIETGFNYSYADIKASSMYFPDGANTWDYKSEILSIPITINYTLLKFLFVNGGPLIDYQNVGSGFDSQSGIGYSIGFGVKYKFKNIILSINPNFKKHAVIPFEKNSCQQRLTEKGIQFGIGYYF